MSFTDLRGWKVNKDPLTFTVTPDEAQLIINGLGELPAKWSLPLILNLQQQASQQSQSHTSPMSSEGGQK